MPNIAICWFAVSPVNAICMYKQQFLLILAWYDGASQMHNGCKGKEGRSAILESLGLAYGAQ